MARQNSLSGLSFYLNVDAQHRLRQLLQLRVISTCLTAKKLIDRGIADQTLGVLEL